MSLPIFNSDMHPTGKTLGWGSNEQMSFFEKTSREQIVSVSGAGLVFHTEK